MKPEPRNSNTSSPCWLKPVLWLNTRPQPGFDVLRFDDLRAVGDRVADEDGLRPAQVDEAGRRAALRRLPPLSRNSRCTRSRVSTTLRIHRACGLPAGGGEPAEMALPRRLVHVEALRIVEAGEGDDIVLREGLAPELDVGAGLQILEPACEGSCSAARLDAGGRGSDVARRAAAFLAGRPAGMAHLDQLRVLLARDDFAALVQECLCSIDTRPISGLERETRLCRILRGPSGCRRKRSGFSQRISSMPGAPMEAVRTIQWS